MLVLRRPEVVYTHILSFFAQGPHIGLASSHFRCRFRHVMLKLPGQQRHDTVRMQEALTIHSSFAGRGLGAFVGVAVYRASAEASLRCHESMYCRCCCDREPDSFWSAQSNSVPVSRGCRNPFQGRYGGDHRGGGGPRYPAFGSKSIFWVYSNECVTISRLLMLY